MLLRTTTIALALGLLSTLAAAHHDAQHNFYGEEQYLSEGWAYEFSFHGFTKHQLLGGAISFGTKKCQMDLYSRGDEVKGVLFEANSMSSPRERVKGFSFMANEGMDDLGYPRLTLKGEGKKLEIVEGNHVAYRHGFSKWSCHAW